MISVTTADRTAVIGIEIASCVVQLHVFLAWGVTCVVTLPVEVFPVNGAFDIVAVVMFVPADVGA